MLTRRESRSFPWVLSLVVLATVTAHLAASTLERSAVWPLAHAMGLICMMVVLRRGSLAGIEWRNRSCMGGLCVLAFVAWPMVEAMLSGLAGGGIPFEVVALRMVLGAALGLCSQAKECQRDDHFAVVTSAFVIVFATAISAHLAVRIGALLYVGMALAWRHTCAQSSFQSVTSGTRRFAAPRIAGILIGMVVIGATVVLIGPRALEARWGWLPASGGTDLYDPFARNGVGDGDALVRAETDASSVAPIADTQVFLATDTPSLYDMFNDMYGEPSRPKEMERAVALPADLTPRDEQQVATSKQAGREFSTTREPPQRRGIADRESRAVLHLAGRTPVHLRLAAFDVFDGREWYPAQMPEDAPPLQMQNSSRAPWLHLRKSTPAATGTAPEHHSLKIVALNAAAIPTLAESTHLKIDRVDRAHYFEWLQPGIVGLQGRTQIPALIVVDLQSQLESSVTIANADVSNGDGSSANRELALPATDCRARLTAIAQQWTANASTDNEAVTAIIERLRHDYVHDPTAVLSVATTDTVLDFMEHSGRGPDYLFASSAAMLLRALGYRTRVVSGFYAAPDRYDRRSGLTPVLPEDVHFWLEVRGASGDWIPFEPTPGYELLQPRLTWRQMFANMADAFTMGVARHRIWFVVGIPALALSYRSRFRLADSLSNVAWSNWTRICPEAVEVSTLRLLDWRSTWAGNRREPGTTLQQWLNQMPASASCPVSIREAFLVELSEALYAPPGVTACRDDIKRSVLQQRRERCAALLKAYRIVQMRNSRTMPTVLSDEIGFLKKSTSNL